MHMIFIYNISINITIYISYSSIRRVTKEGKLKIYIFYTNIIMYTINYGIYVIYFKFLLSA